MLQLSCFECDAEQDPNYVCDACGYPMCPECGEASECFHTRWERYKLPSPLKKRFKHAEECCEFMPSQIMCTHCGNSFCVECYEMYAIRFGGDDFRPSIAWKYSKEINQAALGLYWINKRKEKTLPKDILLKIISFL